MALPGQPAREGRRCRRNDYLTGSFFPCLCGGALSFAYLPFYTGDYFRDTRGLSMAGHGCYFLLLTYCWDTQGPLPLDEERIAGICEARNQEERNTLSKILKTYFVCMDDGWYNSRMQREIERSANISIARKSSGRKGYLARAKHLPSKSKALAEQVHLSPPPSPSPSPSLKEVQQPVVGADAPPRAVKASKSAATKGTRLPAGWELPEEWLKWAMTSADWDEEKVLRESLVFRDHWHSTTKNPIKLDWFATWRNWIRRAAS